MLSAITGVSDAANILLQMTRKQEALFGGYYSGICTLSDSSFNLKKCIGPASSLSALSGISDLSGNCGLAHTRTKSGGSHRRAQPFVDFWNQLAGMGTGTHGIFSDSKKEERQLLADELIERGIKFSSTEQGIGGSACLPDGSTIHNTELVVQSVGHFKSLGKGHVDAIREVFTRVPGEGAYVFIFEDRPHEIYVANYNLRLLALTLGDRAVVVSSLFGLAAAERIHAREVPANSISVVKAETMKSEQISIDLEELLERDLPEGKALEEAFLQYVRDNPNQSWPNIVEFALLPLFPNNRVNLLMPAAFQLVERLVLSDKILMSIRTVEGISSDTNTVEAVFSEPNNRAL
jgi:glucosamine 6-phosphate synthetase-like amidotransferase/phosphosugar isomerase protein